MAYHYKDTESKEERIYHTAGVQDYEGKKLFDSDASQHNPYTYTKCNTRLIDNNKKHLHNMGALLHRHFVCQMLALYVCLLSSVSFASREFLPDEIAEALQELRKHKETAGDRLSKDGSDAPLADPPGIMTKRLAMPNVLPHQVS